MSNSVEIHPAGSVVPNYSDRSWTASDVVCPFDFAVVPGVDGEAANAELRKKYLGMTPLIFGSPTRAAGLIQTIKLAIQPDEILKQAASIDLDAWLRQRLAYLRRRAGHSADPVPPHGQWPAEAAPTTGLCSVVDLHGCISQQVVIGLLPCTDCDACAYLRFGGWNACPEPAVHVTIARRWAASHGAILTGCLYDTLEFRVARPIVDRDEAMKMAMMHYLYNFETVEQPGSIELAAAALVGSTVWQFWWD